MMPERKELFGRRASYRLVFLVAVLVYLVIQSKFAGEFFHQLRLPDNDDAMRLSSVRDLVAGQGWYDTRQYRALPPEGVLLHWSRLLDAPLAGLYVLFSAFLAPKAALTVTAALWPAAVFLVYLTVVGRTAKAAFGYSAASFAMMAASAMPMISGNFFPLGRVDHHNVQILCMLAICAALISPGRPTVRGAMAGVIAGLSLAIGLEAIAFIGVTGLVLTAQHVLGRPGGTERLLGYAVAMGLTAPVLFLAQTGPDGWGQLYCDQLSGRVLAITTAAMLFAIVLAFSRRVLAGLPARLVLALVLGGLALAALWPVLSPCRAGPYAELPPEIRQGIIGNIVEATPVQRLFAVVPGMAMEIVLPLCLVTLLSLLRLAAGPGAAFPRESRHALGVVLVFLALGVAGSLYQVRAFVWGLAVLPLGFGAVAAWLANGDWGRLWPWKPVITVALAAVTLFPSFLTRNTLAMKLAPALEPSGAAARLDISDKACNAPQELARLNALPAALIMAPLNLGPKILLYTPHSVMGVPYHRSAEALLSGVLPFFGDAPEMEKRVQAYRVDYVLVCAGEVYGGRADSMGSRLARGALPGWLEPVEIGGGPIRVMKVLRGANGELRDGDETG